MNKGFTLVELSIVLVIIGLLIGGILVGQSLINSAKINKQIQQIQQIEIAVKNFKLNYKCLPGDCTKMTSGGTQPTKVRPGNGDGMIFGSSAAGANAGWPPFTNAASEWAWVFDHLAVTGMYKFQTYDDEIIDSNRAGVAYPKMILDDFADVSLGNKGGVIVGWEQATNYVTEGHKIRLGACSGSSTGPAYPNQGMSFYCSPSLPDMKALDAKLDDGKPFSGTVVATSNYYVYRFPGGYYSDATACCANSTTNQYKDSVTITSQTQGNYLALEISTSF